MSKQENCRLAKDARESGVANLYRCLVYFEETNVYHTVSFQIAEDKDVNGSAKLKKIRDSLTLTKEQYQACVRCIGREFGIKLSVTNTPSNQDLGIIEGLSDKDRRRSKAALKRIKSRLFSEHAEVNP